jgi:hypothetical protein
MKQSQESPLSNIKVLCIVMLSSIVFILGCQSGLTPVPQKPDVTENDIADVIASSLGGSTSTNGLTVQIGEAATVAGGGVLSKRSRGEIAAAVSVDTTIMRHDTSGADGYEFTFHYSYAFSTGGDTLDFGFKMDGISFNSALLSNDSAVSSIRFTGIVGPDSQYTVNGVYLRSGTQAFYVRDQNSFTSADSVILTNVKVKKTTGQIQSGSASISVLGKTPNNNFFSYSATLTFSGSQLATLHINGKTYSINLASGIATPI